MPTYSKYSPAPFLPIQGVDKHYGRHASYFSIKLGTSDPARNFFAWTRISQSGSVDVRENTNPGSSLRTSQVMREEPPTFEIEVNLPFQETGPDGARAVINYLRAGVIMQAFNVGAVAGSSDPGVFEAGYLQKFGSYIIERSSVEVSRDDFTSVRATVRALGYVGGQNLPAPPPVSGTATTVPTAAP